MKLVTFLQEYSDLLYMSELGRMSGISDIRMYQIKRTGRIRPKEAEELLKALNMLQKTIRTIETDDAQEGI